MSQSNRYFEIIQILRSANRPVLARDLAASLEVSVRTIYRDIAALQARQIPVEGAAGIGYVMQRGYDLPPINLDAEEADAIALGLSMIARTGDRDLWRAAKRAHRKLIEVAPGTQNLIASPCGAEPPLYVDMAVIRQAVRDETKLDIVYRSDAGAETRRTIWPIVVIYYPDVTMAAAWCELRDDLRHFRVDRIQRCAVLPDRFAGLGGRLLQEWEKTHKNNAISASRL